MREALKDTGLIVLISMKKKSKDKLFVIRKFIKASSALDAIKKDRSHPVNDVWIEDEWKKGGYENLASAIGFEIENESID